MAIDVPGLPVGSRLFWDSAIGRARTIGMEGMGHASGACGERRSVGSGLGQDCTGESRTV